MASEIEEANNLEPTSFQLLLDMIPPKFQFVMRYLLAISCDDPQKLLSYSISPIRKRNLILRMAESLKSGHAIKENELADIDSVKSLRRVLRNKCEKAKVFYNQNLSKAKHLSSLKNSNPQLYQKLLEVMQQIARSLHGNSKDRGDTPADSIYLIPDDFREELGEYTGGVTSRMTSVVNDWLKTNKCDIQLSETSIENMFDDAKIVFKKSKNNLTQTRLNQHFCSATLKYLMYLAQIFSNEVIYASADGKSLIRVAAGTHVKEAPIQFISEMKQLPDHDASLDTLGKISLYVIEVIKQDSELYDFNNVAPVNNEDISKLGYIKIDENTIPGWRKETHTKSNKGLGVAFAHHHNLYPENGARNASDICEMIYSYLPYFQSQNGDLKSTFFLQVDNSKGAADAQTRFVWVLMFLKFDFDTIVICSPAGGCSRFNPVEQLNGFLSNRVNCYAIEFENSDIFQFLSKEDFLQNMEKALDRVVDITDGTTCNRTGGCIDVKKASHPPTYEGFKFIPEEIIAFLASKDKDNFKSKDQIDFGNGIEVTEFYNAAWRILHSTNGTGKCVHITNHTMTIMKNPENVDIVHPIRGSQELYNIFKSFGGTIPLPLPSKKPFKQSTEGNSCPRYMDFQEMLELPANERLQSINKYHLPMILFNEYFIQNPQFMKNYIDNNKQIDSNIMITLQLLLRARKKDIHTDLANRHAKIVMKAREKELKLSQKNRTIDTQVLEYIQELPQYGGKSRIDELKQFMKDNNIPDRRGNKPILIEKIYNFLLDRKIIEVHPPIAVIIEGANALNNAFNAFIDYEDQDNHSVNNNEIDNDDSDNNLDINDYNSDNDNDEIDKEN